MLDNAKRLMKIPYVLLIPIFTPNAYQVDSSSRMSVSIKVAVRCRPFTIPDKLGVYMQQNGDEEGEVNLINTDYTTTRFPFTWAWWSAYGYQVIFKLINHLD